MNAIKTLGIGMLLRYAATVLYLIGFLAITFTEAFLIFGLTTAVAMLMMLASLVFDGMFIWKAFKEK